MQYCAAVRATCRKQKASQLRMDCRGEGVDCVVLRSYPRSVSTILSSIIAISSSLIIIYFGTTLV